MNTKEHNSVNVSSRVKALSWWNSLPEQTKKTFTIGIGRNPSYLTGREIENIWKSTQLSSINQFDEESFRSYISKFSDDDQIKAYEVFVKILLETNKRMHL